MSLDWRPRIVYDLAELVLELPQRPWTPLLAHEGGGNKSAIGIRERFTIRNEDLVEVRLRFYDHEWEAVSEFLRWARSDSGGFIWYPDRDDSAVSYSVDLERPDVGEEIRPERMTEFLSAWEISLVLRRLDAGTFPAAYIRTDGNLSFDPDYNATDVALESNWG